MEEIRTIEFKLKGRINDILIKPDTLDISFLSEFLEDVKSLVTPEKLTRNERQPITVSYQEGSALLNVALSLTLYTGFVNEIETLEKTKSLNYLPAKKARVIEKWQNDSSKNPFWFEICPSDDPFMAIKIDKNSHYSFRQDANWRQTEIVIAGEVKSLGGVKVSNLKVSTRDYGNVTVKCKPDFLANEEKNRVYKNIMIRVKALKNIHTKQITDAELINFIDYAPTFNPEQHQEYINRGTELWADTKDAVAWKRHLRGDDE